jgi:uncharacterized protein YcbX
MAYATITNLNLYAVKSCRGAALDQATVRQTGLEGDRGWMVVDETGRYVSQREAPRLALIAPRVGDRELSLSAPGMPELRVPNIPPGPAIDVIAMADRCTALDAGDEAEDWLTRYLGMQARLVRFDPAGTRSTNPEYGGTDAPIQFPDAFPLLVICQESLDDLNSRLADPVPMNRFRPNIVLEGLAPYDEDRIQYLTQGDLTLRMVFPCPRCKITTIDQARGEPGNAEPLATLVTYRGSKQPRGVLFGHYAIVESGAGSRLEVGQRLDIQWK